MKNKMIIFWTIGTVALIIIGILVWGKEKDVQPINDGSYFVTDKRYNSDGLLIVSTDTYPELFKAYVKNTKTSIHASGELYVGYYETDYIDEKGQAVCENYRQISIFDEKLDEIKEKIHRGNSFDYSEPMIEDEVDNNEKCIVDFLCDRANDIIDEPYVLIYPDQYVFDGELKKVDSFGQLYEVENIKTVVYPESAEVIMIYGCFDLETVECNSRLTVCSIAKCPKLECDLGLKDGENIISCFSTINECDKIEKFYMPESVAAIDDIFNKCISLEEYSISDGVIMMTSSFNNNVNLKEVYIPDSVKIIKNCFENCENIVLSVGEGTEAEKYAIENGLKYLYH